jgi:hypothetical protein
MLYFLAIILAFVHVYIALTIYILVPLIFFIPVSQENILKELEVE